MLGTKWVTGVGVYRGEEMIHIHNHTACFLWLYTRESRGLQKQPVCASYINASWFRMQVITYQPLPSCAFPPSLTIWRVQPSAIAFQNAFLSDPSSEPALRCLSYSAWWTSSTSCLQQQTQLIINSVKGYEGRMSVTSINFIRQELATLKSYNQISISF